MIKTQFRQFRLRLVIANCLLLTALASLCAAQTPAFTTVQASHIYGQGNIPLASGTISFAPVDASGNPISYQIGGGGQQVNYPTVCSIAGGIILPGCQLANTIATNPANICFSVTVKNALNQVVIGGSQTSGYQCAQPATNNLWCAAAVCNFDQFVPNINGVAVAQLPTPTAFSLGGIYALPCGPGNVSQGFDVFGRNICVPNGSGSGSSAWGGITGTITSQTDLIAYLATFAPLASPSFSGTPTVPTPLTGDNSLTIVNSAWVRAQLYATLLSPAFGGTPTAPTPAGSDNSTRIPTTAWVKSLGYLTAAPVTTVAGRTGAIVLAEGDITNLTSDLALKAPITSPNLLGVPTAPTPPTVDSTTKIATTAWVVAQGYAAGTGNVTGPGSAAVGNIATFNATNGQLLADAGFGFPLAPSHIGTFAAGSNGFVASAFIDATNAANIGTGILPAARLPNPSLSTLGGIQALACGSHQWFNNLSTLGILNCLQPTFSDINTLFTDNGTVGGYTGAQWQMPGGTAAAPGWSFAPALAIGMYQSLNPAQWNVTATSGTGTVATITLGNTSGWTFSQQWQPGTLANISGVGSGYDCFQCVITAYNLGTGTISYASTATASVATGHVQQWNLAFSTAAHKVIFNSLQSSSANCPQNGSIQLCGPDALTGWYGGGLGPYTVIMIQKNALLTQGDQRAVQVGDPIYGFVTATGAPARFNGAVTLNLITGTQCLSAISGVITGTGGPCLSISGSMTTDFLVTAASSSSVKTGGSAVNASGAAITNIGSLTSTGAGTFGSIIQTGSVAANSVFGNCTSGSAAPSYQAITTGCLPAAASVARAFSVVNSGCTGAQTWALAGSGFVNGTLTLGATGTCVLNLTGLLAGGQYVLTVVQNGVGSRLLTLGTGCTWKVSSGGGGVITPSASAGATDVLTFMYDGANCLANYTKNFN